MKMKRALSVAMVFIGLMVTSGSSVMAAGKPLKVYILVGQSNMEGQADIRTFDYIGDDPATAPMLKEMRNADGTPRVCQDVTISYATGRGGWGKPMIPLVKEGKLTAGFAASDSKIGPEFTFGIYMQKQFKQPILIIKTAWGGKSLSTDLRPPSAGPYKLPKETLDIWAKHPQGAHGIPSESARKEWWNKKNEATGYYYRQMSAHVKKVLADIKKVYPGYDPKQGYELAGFVWFQGWNDMCDSHTYPQAIKPNRYAYYSELMADFIRDVRKDFNAPKMPFVIGVMGVGGIQEKPNDFRLAMAAPAQMREFKGNVVAVETAPYWDKALGEIDAKNAEIRQMGYLLKSKNKSCANKDGKMTKEDQAAYLKKYRVELITPEDEALRKRGSSNASYHYLGCAKTMALIGKAFAEATAEMENE